MIEGREKKNCTVWDFGRAKSVYLVKEKANAEEFVLALRASLLLKQKVRVEHILRSQARLEVDQPSSPKDP